MLRTELIKQTARPRTLALLVALALLPVVAAIATAGDAGGRHGSEVGLYGAATYSALNHAAASLQFVAPLLLVVVVALLGSAVGAADAQWGTLRYLLIRPVGRRSLVTGKLLALALLTAGATAVVVLAGASSGLVVFGWHPFHRLGTTSLSGATAMARLVGASAYVALCSLTVGVLAFAVALVSRNVATGLVAAVAVTVVGDLASNLPGLSAVRGLVPNHYWGRWADWLEGGASHGLVTGAAVQVAAIALVAGAAIWAFVRTDVVH